ncbi:MAG: hypothetical protein GY703_13285 [Gammaproteobacteria bacterium]|nr:hypothetical protein [Gammaproteobacteria bacterium]
MKPALAILTVAVLVQSCSRMSPDPHSYFPLQTGMRWDYDVTATIAGKARHSDFSIYIAEPETIDETLHAVRVTSDGTRYYIRNTDAGIYRAAKRTLVEMKPRLDDESSWVLKKPYEKGTNWTNATHPFVLRRIHPYEEQISGGVNLKMTYQIMSLLDQVNVPAGQFDHCLRVEGEAQFTLYADGRTGYADIVVSTTEWYAPGVGLVKLVRDEPLTSDVFTGGKVEFELKRLTR